jgi:hypothetical protein
VAGIEQAGKGFISAIVGPFKELGIDLIETEDVLRGYASESIARLTTIIGQPGFELAVQAERDILAIKAGLQLVKDADRSDMRAIGLIEGALRMAASLVTGGIS